MISALIFKSIASSQVKWLERTKRSVHNRNCRDALLPTNRITLLKIVSLDIEVRVRTSNASSSRTLLERTAERYHLCYNAC